MSNSKVFHKLNLALPVCLLFALGLIVGCGDDSPTSTNNNNQQTWDEDAGWIGVFADQNGTNCSLQDNGTGTVTYYVVHQGSPGASACEFKLSSSYFTGVNLGMSSPFSLVIGNDPFADGVSVAYSTCKTDPVHVLTLTFTTTGMAPSCATISVLPNAATDGLHVTDCNQPVPNILRGRGKTSYINNDGSCPCSPTPVSPGSWEKIRNVMK